MTKTKWTIPHTTKVFFFGNDAEVDALVDHAREVIDERWQSRTTQTNIKKPKTNPGRFR
jgi:hypothetical protein